jgi:hypothetical protein
MLDFELTPEQRIKIAGVINNISEIPVRLTVDCGRTFGDMIQAGGEAILRITTIAVLFNIKLTDEQLYTMMNQAFDSMKYRIEKIKDIAESITSIHPEETDE